MKLNKKQRKQIEELIVEKGRLIQDHTSRIYLQFVNEVFKIVGLADERI